MKFILGMILLVIPFTAMSSNPQIDSLLTVLNGQERDTNRVWTLVELAKGFKQESQDQAVKYAHLARDLSIELDFRPGIFECDFQLGELLRLQRDIEGSLKHGFEAMEIAESLGDVLKLATAYGSIGNSYMYNKEYDLAREYFQRSKDIYLKNGEPGKVAYPTHNIATSYLMQGEDKAALPYFQENLKYFEEQANFMAMAATHNNIGRCFFGLERYDEALESYQIAYDLKKGANNARNLISTRQNIAEVFVHQGKYKQGEAILQGTLNTADSLGLRVFKIDGYDRLATSYARQGAYQKAYENMLLYAGLKDSIRTERNDERAEALRKSIAFKDQEIEISELQLETDRKEAQNKLQLAIIWGAVLILALLIVLIVFLVLSNRSRKRKNEELSRLNREKDGLLGMVAHDLKAPLNSTLGIIEVLKGQGMQDSQEKLLEMAGEACSKGVDLIGDLLELNKLEGGGARPALSRVDLNEILERKRETFSAQAEQKKIGISIVEKSEDGQLETAPDYLDRILDNLISNAIKFSPQGSEVKLALQRQANHYLVSVSDQGPGFTEEDRQKMYASFQKLSARPTAGEHSTGLGLAIVKSLVQKLDGEIVLETAVGKGSTFTIELPSLS